MDSFGLTFQFGHQLGATACWISFGLVESSRFDQNVAEPDAIIRIHIQYVDCGDSALRLAE